MKKMGNKLHLGCGQNYLNGWINIDIDSPKADNHFDLRKPMPYPDYSADFIFNEHFIEHVTLYESISFLKECYRVLKLGGVLRISTPDLDWMVEKYMQGNLDEWKDVGWRPGSKCLLLNQGMRMWGHQFVYDFLELCNTLSIASFYKIEKVSWRKSIYKELNMLEFRPYHREIIIEATK
jgi:predicted SAM-dependent methyltransferase